MSNYATAAEGDAYFATRLRTRAWDEATSGDQDKALAMATRIIDQLNFLGTKTEEEQENQFPRDDDDTVPTAIRDACLEIALALLDGVDPGKEYENLFKTSNSYGGVRTTFDTDVAPAHVVAGVPSFDAWKLLLPYLRDPKAIKLRRAD